MWHEQICPERSPMPFKGRDGAKFALRNWITRMNGPHVRGADGRREKSSVSVPALLAASGTGKSRFLDEVEGLLADSSASGTGASSTPASISINGLKSFQATISFNGAFGSPFDVRAEASWGAKVSAGVRLLRAATNPECAWEAFKAILGNSVHKCTFSAVVEALQRTLFKRDIRLFIVGLDELNSVLSASAPATSSWSEADQNAWLKDLLADVTRALTAPDFGVLLLPILAGTLFSSVFDAVRGSSTRVEQLPLPMLLESEVLELLHLVVGADVLSCWGIGLRFAMANSNPRAVGAIARVMNDYTAGPTSADAGIRLIEAALRGLFGTLPRPVVPYTYRDAIRFLKWIVLSEVPVEERGVFEEWLRVGLVSSAGGDDADPQPIVAPFFARCTLEQFSRERWLLTERNFVLAAIELLDIAGGRAIIEAQPLELFTVAFGALREALVADDDGTVRMKRLIPGCASELSWKLQPWVNVVRATNRFPAVAHDCTIINTSTGESIDPAKNHVNLLNCDGAVWDGALLRVVAALAFQVKSLGVGLSHEKFDDALVQHELVKHTALVEMNASLPWGRNVELAFVTTRATPAASCDVVYGAGVYVLGPENGVGFFGRTFLRTPTFSRGVDNFSAHELHVV